MKNYVLCVFVIFTAIISCDTAKGHKNPLQQVLSSDNPKIKRVMDSIGQHEVQIIYTQIDRKEGRVHFTDFEFQVNSSQYFYPASTVKFPVALLALSKLNQMEHMDRNTRFYIEGDTVETTFAAEIQKIFAVSDNEAYNRLFEFLGQDYINDKLSEKAFGPIRISHRLSAPNADEITTKPLVIYENDSTTTITAPIINTSAKALTLNGTEKGKGFYSDGELVDEAFDFSLKNHYPIRTQHQFLKTVMFPEQFTPDQKINLRDDQLEFVHKAMHKLPKKMGYDPETYYDGYCKFFIYGDTKNDIPEHIKIYNKVGDAYGTLTDCAYVKDTKNDVEFMLTATILVNKDGIFNDDAYEYDEIGFPFLAELGREIHQLEIDRKK
ncbi:serine hydrolase [Costertonia aggregata]|uniref:Serine hydrolase n=1 Tax=Costertonia aggregata TaxID=343403 RepID=A0A7H9ALD5_9FLAO|nr:serine hydrolase [Costertonia aggregata]QLG44174.1 serine hydrolase [Costertonia aggregata]